MILTQSASMIVPLVPAMQHLYLSHKNPTNRTGFDGAVGLSSPGTWQSGWILDPSVKGRETGGDTDGNGKYGSHDPGK
jgi:hypothetical protein